MTALVIPRDDCVFMDADYSQIEYRTMVALANEPTLKEQFEDPDNDYHTMMAALMFGIPYAAVTDAIRSIAKSLNFGIPYGMGIVSLAIMLTGNASPESIVLAQERYEQYFENQPNVRKFFEDVKNDAKNTLSTTTLWGRKRGYNFTTSDGRYSTSLEAKALRQAANAKIQGCLSGDTLIQTKKYGIVKIEEMNNRTLEVWNGTKWTTGDIVYSGKKRKCIITFSNNQKFICSPDHKFLVKRAKTKESFIRCVDLIARFEHSNKNISSDNPHKIDYVGFVDNTNQEELKTLIVDKIEITDEYIDMYDVCNTEDGYYVAEGLITHNTAADIFKIGVARTWMYIRKNNLIGKVHISNLVHDEQLIEINVKELNVQKILTDIILCMELNLEKYNFPPLFVGAGIGSCWKDAKGKLAEIHPYLANRLKTESKNKDIYNVEIDDVKEVLGYFDSRVYDYRREVVATYLQGVGLTDSKFKSSVGNLINLQFDYKLDAGIDTSNVNVVLYHRIKRFIEEFNIDVDINSYSYLLGSNDNVAVYDSEAEKEELEAIIEDDLELEDIKKAKGKQIEETTKLGVDVVNIAKNFGYCIDKANNLVVLNMDVGNKELKLGYVQLHSKDTMGKDAMGCKLIINDKLVNFNGLLYGVNVNNLDLVFLNKQ